MVGFSTFHIIQRSIVLVELQEGGVVQKRVSVGCVGLLTGSFGFCRSITFSFTAAFIRKKCVFFRPFVLQFFNSSLTSGTVYTTCALLYESKAKGIVSWCTTAVAAMFGADKRRAAGGLLAGSMQTTADGAVIMSGPASEGVKEGLQTGAFLYRTLQVVRLYGTEEP